MVTDLPWVASVVRVSVTTREHDFDHPWQATPGSRFGAAVVIGPGLLLTCANTVANATYVTAELPLRADKPVLRVRAVHHDRDLALLEVVSRSELFATLPVVELGAMPALWDEVALACCPDGGATVVTARVSTMGVVRYSHTQHHLLAVEIDAELGENDGGGAVFRDGTLVGIVHQRRTGGPSCEFVPVPIIRAFLDGVRAGKSLQLRGYAGATQVRSRPH